MPTKYNRPAGELILNTGYLRVTLALSTRLSSARLRSQLSFAEIYHRRTLLSDLAVRRECPLITSKRSFEFEVEIFMFKNVLAKCPHEFLVRFVREKVMLVQSIRPALFKQAPSHVLRR